MFLVSKPVSGFFSPTGVVAHDGVNYSTVLEESVVINLSENRKVTVAQSLHVAAFAAYSKTGPFSE